MAPDGWTVKVCVSGLQQENFLSRQPEPGGKPTFNPSINSLQAIHHSAVESASDETTDGPNSARGESYVSGIKTACFPCETSLGASFGRDMLYRVRQEIAKEARKKAANILLPPALNVIRS
ncbi:uncharacterized protein BDV17DRAFT_289921 [Aspergillus undulatus]|uniref:uncharacterized protein n=1 Tax=Aspergillus undulatus TaxID=1810928 RepID=UPI003CCE1493